MKPIIYTTLIIAGMVMFYKWGQDNPNDEHWVAYSQLKDENLRLRSDCHAILDNQIKDGLEDYMNRANNIRK